MLAKGEPKWIRRHPLRGGPAKTDGSTCGTCRQCYLSHDNGNRRYYKCRLVGVTFGAATDVKVRWPGCLAWAAKDPEPEPESAG